MVCRPRHFRRMRPFRESPQASSAGLCHWSVMQPTGAESGAGRPQRLLLLALVLGGPPRGPCGRADAHGPGPVRRAERDRGRPDRGRRRAGHRRSQPGPCLRPGRPPVRVGRAGQPRRPRPGLVERDRAGADRHRRREPGVAHGHRPVRGPDLYRRRARRRTVGGRPRGRPCGHGRRRPRAGAGRERHGLGRGRGPDAALAVRGRRGACSRRSIAQKGARGPIPARTATG